MPFMSEVTSTMNEPVSRISFSSRQFPADARKTLVGFPLAISEAIVGPDNAMTVEPGMVSEITSDMTRPFSSMPFVVDIITWLL